MKTKNVLFLAVISLIVWGSWSCNDVTTDYASSPFEYYYIFSMKTDYSKNIFVMINKEKKIAYPNPPAAYGKFLQLRDNYWATPGGFTIDGREAVTDLSLSEYESLWNEYYEKNENKLRDTLFSRIIDYDPFIDIYVVRITDERFSKITYRNGEVYQYVGPDVEKINSLLESGEFFTYEGVERIK